MTFITRTDAFDFAIDRSVSNSMYWYHYSLEKLSNTFYNMHMSDLLVDAEIIFLNSDVFIIKVLHYCCYFNTVRISRCLLKNLAKKTKLF